MKYFKRNMGSNDFKIFSGIVKDCLFCALRPAWLAWEVGWLGRVAGLGEAVSRLGASGVWPA